MSPKTTPSHYTDPKPTLKEELAAEKEEEVREKKYEDSVARRSRTSSGNYKHYFS